MSLIPRIRIQQADFDTAAEYRRLCVDQSGALATFVGRVRRDDGIRALHLEHYPGMTEKVLQRIAADAARRWSLLDLTIVHRVGTLHAGVQIVFVGVASEHRADAFAACEYVMDLLKTQAPFWKQEIKPDGCRWVEAKLSDTQRAAIWTKPLGVDPANEGDSDE